MPPWGWPLAQVDEGEILDRLLGPQALLVGAIIVIFVLWREWRSTHAARIAALDKAIADRDTRIVDLTRERDVALEGWRAQTDATNRVADTLETDRRDRENRRRMSDRSSP